MEMLKPALVRLPSPASSAEEAHRYMLLLGLFLRDCKLADKIRAQPEEKGPLVKKFKPSPLSNSCAESILREVSEATTQLQQQPCEVLEVAQEDLSEGPPSQHGDAEALQPSILAVTPEPRGRGRGRARARARARGATEPTSTRQSSRLQAKKGAPSH